MGPEHEVKTVAEVRKGLLFRQFMRGASWSPEIRAQVPNALWADKRVDDGWISGPLIKSMTGIADPQLPGVFWTVWVFQRGAMFARSTEMPATSFVSVWDIANDARANPGDTPTAGI